MYFLYPSEIRGGVVFIRREGEVAMGKPSGMGWVSPLSNASWAMWTRFPVEHMGGELVVVDRLPIPKHLTIDYVDGTGVARPQLVCQFGAGVVLGARCEERPRLDRILLKAEIPAGGGRKPSNKS